MTTLVPHLSSLLHRLAGAPAAMVVQLADDADEVWEPFLSDAATPVGLEA